MLRRKRGNEYDLSDDDDGGEARRRMKRRQFAKMQKALFSDERVKKMAENPGNQAFLRTLEDQASDDDMDLLEITEVPESQSDSQSQAAEAPTGSQTGVVPDSQPPRKELSSADGNTRPPAHLRRTKEGKKPSNIGEVRETLSDLLDEPQGSFIPATEAGSDSEDDADSTKENQNPRRSGIVDRISLKRSSSSSLSITSSRLAFTAGAAGGSGSFKVPNLLRRATSNSFASTSSSTSTAPGAATSGFAEQGSMARKVSGKKTGVNAFSRAGAPVGVDAKVKENERRRQEKRVKGAERRMGVVGGLLGKGSFE